MLQLALSVLLVLALYVVAVRAIARATSPTYAIAGGVCGIVVTVVASIAIGPQAAFWFPFFLAEGFLFGFILAWAVHALMKLRRRCQRRSAPSQVPNGSEPLP